MDKNFKHQVAASLLHLNALLQPKSLLLSPVDKKFQQEVAASLLHLDALLLS